MRKNSFERFNSNNESNYFLKSIRIHKAIAISALTEMILFWSFDDEKRKQRKLQKAEERAEKERLIEVFTQTSRNLVEQGPLSDEVYEQHIRWSAEDKAKEVLKKRRQAKKSQNKRNPSS